ncbi:hypothetical protein [Pandoraea sp. PE-S2T-3]|uniref:hypothetical protein n=1 Tax=Pandoraea sp. PE-S2T-3 TaxID=1986993 RepID=UPI00159593E3|nr:hypothetical protein [Pandoraea sp. PE-S2T-3]
MTTTDRKPLALRSITAVFAQPSAGRAEHGRGQGRVHPGAKCLGDDASQGEV